MEGLRGRGRAAEARLGPASEDTSRHHGPGGEQSWAPVAAHP